MSEGVESDFSWMDVASYYYANRWLWVLVCFLVLIVVGRKTFDHHIPEHAFWRKIFLTSLVVVVFSNLFLFGDDWIQFEENPYLSMALDQ